MKANDFLGKPITKDYLPSAYLSGWFYTSRLPPFTLYTINNMLIDSRVVFGLWLIKGPILAHSKFHIKCSNPEVKAFLIDTISHFWRTSALRALKSVEWGYSCSEALYEYSKEKQKIVFKSLKDLHPLDSRAVTQDGSLVGATIRNVPSPRGVGMGNKKVALYGPKVLWHVHGREFHPWYGRSRLYGAYQPWMETWTDGGYRDSRRLFFHKYAFDGGTIYHPPGITKVMTSEGMIAQEISNKDLARELVEKKKTGGSMTLPNTLLDTGVKAWEYVPPIVTAPPTHIMEYGDSLKDEIWEGMGIPPEIARAEGTGAYAGRAIPMQAFYSILQEIMLGLISDADEQLFKPLVKINFGEVWYEIQPFKLEPPSESQPEQSPSPSEMPSGKQSGGMSMATPDESVDVELLLPNPVRYSTPKPPVKRKRKSNGKS